MFLWIRFTSLNTYCAKYVFFLCLSTSSLLLFVDRCPIFSSISFLASRLVIVIKSPGYWPVANRLGQPPHHWPASQPHNKAPGQPASQLAIQNNHWPASQPTETSDWPARTRPPTHKPGLPGWRKKPSQRVANTRRKRNGASQSQSDLKRMSWPICPKIPSSTPTASRIGTR